MAILPASSAEKKSPFLSEEETFKEPEGDADDKGVLRFLVGGRLEGPPLEPPGLEGGWTPLTRAGRAGVGVRSRRSLFVCDSKA